MFCLTTYLEMKVGLNRKTSLIYSDTIFKIVCEQHSCTHKHKYTQLHSSISRQPRTFQKRLVWIQYIDIMMHALNNDIQTEMCLLAVIHQCGYVQHSLTDIHTTFFNRQICTTFLTHKQIYTQKPVIYEVKMQSSHWVSVGVNEYLAAKDSIVPAPKLKLDLTGCKTCAKCFVLLFARRMKC